jgi:hypothetical protein
MQGMRLLFMVAVVVLIAAGAADPAHANTVTVTANGTPCGTVGTIAGSTSATFNFASCARHLPSRAR